MTKDALANAEQQLRQAVAAWELLRKNKATFGAIAEAHAAITFWKRRVKALKARGGDGNQS